VVRAVFDGDSRKYLAVKQRRSNHVLWGNVPSTIANKNNFT